MLDNLTYECKEFRIIHANKSVGQKCQKMQKKRKTVKRLLTTSTCIVLSTSNLRIDKQEAVSMFIWISCVKCSIT